MNIPVWCSRVFCFMAAFEMTTKVEIKLNPKWEQVEELLAQATQIAARNIERTSKEACPVDTGATRNSIQARETGRLEWTIGPSTHYAPHLEFGTVHMAAQPFMIPNAEKERPRFVEAVRQITQDL